MKTIVLQIYIINITIIDTEMNASDKKYNYVYITTNLINGRQYVGDRACKCDPKNDKYIGSGSLLNKKIKEYGKENFKKEILEFFSTKQKAFNAQEKYIKEYNTLVPNGYNISPKGGHQCKDSVSEYTKQKIKHSLTGVRHSPERIEKNKNSHLGIKYSEERCEKQRKSMMGKNKGKTMSELQKEKLRLFNLGKKHSEETKEKMRNSHKGLFKGYKHTEISKKNMSESHKGIKQSEESKQRKSIALKLYWANKNKI